VHGDGDRLVPHVNAIQLARHLPASRLHVLPEEGHLLVFDPGGAALPLLADFFARPTLEESESWATGTVVDDDETVERAFADTPGTEPYRALSWAFRRVVQRLT
jgi:hypothetical protein